jgi:predicted transcriptional regulator
MSDSICQVAIQTDLWCLYIPDGDKGLLKIPDMSTQDLVDSPGYHVLAGSLSVELTEQQKRNQKESDKRRRKEQARHREQKATEIAKEKREQMLNTEYETLVSIMASGRSYERHEFVTLVKKIADPFVCEVVVDEQEMIAFANQHEAGALNFTIHKMMTGSQFGGMKRPLPTDGNDRAPKRQNQGRMVPTRHSEDGITAMETLLTKDSLSEKEKQKKEHKVGIRELAKLEKFQSELSKLQKKQGVTYFDVQDSPVKTHVTLIYRLFDGPLFSKTTLNDMKTFLFDKKVDSDTAKAKLALLDSQIRQLSAQLEELSACLLEEFTDLEESELSAAMAELIAEDAALQSASLAGEFTESEESELSAALAELIAEDDAVEADINAEYTSDLDLA